MSKRSKGRAKNVRWYVKKNGHWAVSNGSRYDGTSIEMWTVEQLRAFAAETATHGMDRAAYLSLFGPLRPVSDLYLRLRLGAIP